MSGVLQCALTMRRTKDMATLPKNANNKILDVQKMKICFLYKDSMSPIDSKEIKTQLNPSLSFCTMPTQGFVSRFWLDYNYCEYH